MSRWDYIKAIHNYPFANPNCFGLGELYCSMTTQSGLIDLYDIQEGLSACMSKANYLFYARNGFSLEDKCPSWITDDAKNELKEIGLLKEAMMVKDKTGNALLSMPCSLTSEKLKEGILACEKYKLEFTMDNTSVFKSVQRPGSDIPIIIRKSLF